MQLRTARSHMEVLLQVWHLTGSHHKSRGVHHCTQSDVLQGHPLYSSKEVRFVFSCGSRTALKDRESLLRETRVQWAGLWQGNEDSKWLQGFEVASETFTMQQKDELQVFTFREPILCVGGLLKARTFLN